MYTLVISCQHFKDAYIEKHSLSEDICIYMNIYTYIYIYLLPHVVTLCLTYADDHYDLQAGLSEDHCRHRRMLNTVSQRAEISVTLAVLSLRLRY